MANPSPVVTTKNGKLKGYVSKATDPSAVPVYNYLSVPFGKPPTGKRRFMPPERSDPWEGVLDATVPLHHPKQHTGVAYMYLEYLPIKDTLGAATERQSEDCLKLNVFTPTAYKPAKLPVMMWVVGGGYMRGEAGIYDGTAVCGMNNVVVVCPNYRVNALGFLSLGRDSKVPGNNAILDLILALEWIRDNIESFGGDPGNVTIFGESAGSGLVELLMMASLSRGLFHRAIALSGSTLSPKLFQKDISGITKIYLDSLGIEEKDPDKVLEILQEMPVERLIDVQGGIKSPTFFAPNLDGKVITDTPENLMRSGQIHRIPFLVGVCNSEGGGILTLLTPPNYGTGCSKADIKPVFREGLASQHPVEVGDALADFLLDAYDSIADDSDPLKYSKIYAEIFGDAIFIVPAIMSATAHTAIRAPTYFFYMTKQPEMNHSDTNGPTLKNKFDFVKCDHGDICHYLWGAPFLKGDLPRGAWFTKEEAELSKHFMKYLTNFAKTGNPNQGSPVAVEWPLYDPVTRPYIVFDDEITTGEKLAAKAVELFTVKLPEAARKIGSS